MKIIHSSSLTYPIASNKPRTGLDVINKSSVKPSGAADPGSQTSSHYLQPTTMQQFTTVLTNSGSNHDAVYTQTGNIQTSKAVNAYVQNQNQTSTLLIDQAISGIDLYA